MGYIIDILTPNGDKGGVETVVNRVARRLTEEGHRVRIVQMVYEGVRWADEDIEFYPILVNRKAEKVEDFIGLYASFLKMHEPPSLVVATPWPFMACVAAAALKMNGLKPDRAAGNFCAGSEGMSRSVDDADGSSCAGSEGMSRSVSDVDGSSCAGSEGMSRSVDDADTAGSGVAVVAWLHAPIETYKMYGTGGIESLSFADCCLVLTDKARTQIQNVIPDMRVEKVGNPVNMDGIRTLSHANPDMRKLMFVGRISEEKRLDIVIEAIAKAAGRWELVVAGDGAQRDTLSKKACALGVADRIDWRGWRDNPWEDYDDVTSLVVSSDYEGFCMAAVEALARGIPVISTPVDGVVEYVKPGVNGYFFPKGSSDGLAEVLDAMSSRVLPVIEPSACIRSVEMFESRKVLDNIVSVLSELAGN